MWYALVNRSVWARGETTSGQAMPGKKQKKFNFPLAFLFFYAFLYLYPLQVKLLSKNPDLYFYDFLFMV
jgi:hypothetical protein